MSSRTLIKRESYARPISTLSYVKALAVRALRSLPRDKEMTIPPLIIGVFFFVINVGALEKLVEQQPGLDFKAFQLPVALLFTITGLSRASTLVLDVKTGYLDKLMTTPVKGIALLLGMMIADVVLVAALAIAIICMGFIVGVSFVTGFLGVVVFVLLGVAWGLAFAGFPYAIALKTGNPAAVNTSFLLFFPFMFLTTAFVPMEFLSDWLHTAATYNPVTYLLEGMRSLVSEGWDTAALAKAGGSILAVGTVSMTLALMALKGRTATK